MRRSPHDPSTWGRCSAYDPTLPTPRSAPPERRHCKSGAMGAALNVDLNGRCATAAWHVCDDIRSSPHRMVTKLFENARLIGPRTASIPITDRLQKFLARRHAHPPHPRPSLCPVVGSISSEATTYDSGAVLARQCDQWALRHSARIEH